MEREKVAALLIEMWRSSFRLAQENEANPIMRNGFVHEGMGYHEAADILMDDAYAKKIWSIYFPNGK